MPHAIRIHVHGGPEVMQLGNVDPGEPGRGEVLIRQTAVGLNFIDVYERTGLYANPLPTGLGREAAGVVAAIGPGTRGFALGDRVAYVHDRPGAYAQYRVVPVARLVRIPGGVSDRLAATAGGVGLIAAQWARHLGATVIGVVRIEIGQTYALEDVAQAHRDLEGRRTMGSTVLIP